MYRDSLLLYVGVSFPHLPRRRYKQNWFINVFFSYFFGFFPLLTVSIQQRSHVTHYEYSEYKILYPQSCANCTSKGTTNCTSELYFSSIFLSFVHWIIFGSWHPQTDAANQTRSNVDPAVSPVYRADDPTMCGNSRLFPNQEECLPRTRRWLFGVENKSTSFRDKRNEMPPGSDSEKPCNLKVDLYRFGIRRRRRNDGKRRWGSANRLSTSRSSWFKICRLSLYHRNYPLESPFESASGECLFDLISE